MRRVKTGITVDDYNPVAIEKGGRVRLIVPLSFMGGKRGIVGVIWNIEIRPTRGMII